MTRIVWGRLRSVGITVWRGRLRQAIRTIDSLHTALHWRGDLTGRRPYSVPGPNSLWHLGEIILATSTLVHRFINLSSKN